MTPQEKRNELLAQKMIKNLQRRNMEAFYCPTAVETVKKISALIEDGNSVTWGGSMSVQDLGLPDYLRNRGTLEVLDRDLVETPEEKKAMYLKAFTADVYLTSANAISEDGVIVNIDGNGNRIAAISWGPKKVAPINAQRFDMDTPCSSDGVCHNCHSPESICSYIHFLRNSRTKGRHVVVLVGEPLGY